MKEILTEWRKYLTEAVPNIGYERKSIQDLYADLEKTTDPNARKYLLNYIDQREKRELLHGQEEARRQKRYAGQYGIANLFIDLSNSFKSGTGIRILDPSAPKQPPKWAQKSPVLYATAQTLADIFASDPITLLTWFIGGPTGKATQQEIALQKTIKSISEAEKNALSQLAKKELANGLEKASSAASTGNMQAAQQAIDLAIQETRKKITSSLLQYVEGGEVHSISGEKATELLNLARKGFASLYRGKAWRGIRVSNEKQLFGYIKDITKQEQNLILNGFQQAESNVGKWIEVELSNTRLSGGPRNFSSWSTDINVATNFSRGRGLLMAPPAGETSKFSIIFETSGGRMIDVHETLKKAGTPALEEFQAEKEILGIGDTVIKKIWISTI